MYSEAFLLNQDFIFLLLSFIYQDFFNTGNQDNMVRNKGGRISYM